jgi:hypothetical protein
MGITTLTLTGIYLALAYRTPQLEQAKSWRIRTKNSP